MDTSSTTTLKIDEASLASDVFRSIRLSTFHSNLTNAFHAHGLFLTQLTIECSWLLALGDITGISPDANNPSYLGNEPVQFCANLARFERLLSDYKEDYFDSDQYIFVAAPSASDLEESSDKKRGFEERSLLADLRLLNDNLLKMMPDQYREGIFSRVAGLVREMICRRKRPAELNVLLEAITGTTQYWAGSCAPNAYEPEDVMNVFENLVKLKRLEFVLKDELQQLSERSEPGPVGRVSTLKFVSGTFDYETWNTVLPRDASNPPRWIEWQAVEVWADGSRSDRECELQVATLAEMLSIPKPPHVVIPKCLGFVDERARDVLDSSKCLRVGFCFETPYDSENLSITTLHDILERTEGAKGEPSTQQRIVLALKLASAVSYLHTGNWLHHNIHKGNVSFPCTDREEDIEHPMLTGFGWVRRDDGKMVRPIRRIEANGWDAFRWLKVQNDVPRSGRAKKEHDIYSLGLLLLEIGHWKPLHKLLSLKNWRTSGHVAATIQARLLRTHPHEHRTEDPLQDLVGIVGEEYWRAAKYCITAPNQKDFPVEARFVVEELEKCARRWSFM